MMAKCPKCGSENILFQRETTGTVGAFSNKVYVEPVKRSKGCLYWLLIGWWWQPVYWLCFGWWWRLLFGGKSKGGIGLKADKNINRTMAICQSCGHSWKAK